MRRSRLIQALLPSGVSLVVHAGLLAVIAAVSITAIRLSTPERPSGDLVIALENVGSGSEIAVTPAAGPRSAEAALAPGGSYAASARNDAAALLTPPPIVLTPAIAASPEALPGTAAAFRPAPAQGAAFAGLTASRVRRVVYVVDISGPMASSLSFVLDELRRSVSRLDSSQHFQVILFRQDLGSPRDGGALWLAAPSAGGGAGPRLLPATAANRAALADFLARVRPSGRSNPLAGLRVALGLEPDVVFLLARGISRTGPNARWGEGNAVILGELERLNPGDGAERRRTAIKTIQFIEDDPTGLMQAIAGAHGGSPESYTRRNVEDLERAADVPLPVEAPDPNLERAASLLSDLSVSRVDLRVLFGVAGPEDVAEVRRATARILELAPEPDAAGDADDLSRLVAARALVLRAAADGAGSGREAGGAVGDAGSGLRDGPESRGRLLDRAIALLDTSPGAPAEVLSTAAAAHALRQAPRDAEVASGLARRAVEADSSTTTALEARLAAIAATAADPARCGAWVAELDGAMSRPPFIAGGRLDGPLTLLTLDASALARLRHAGTPGAIDAALAQHLAWARSPRPGLPGDAVRLAAGRLVPADAALDQIDPELALARGLALLPAPSQRPPDEALEALELAALRALPDSEIAETAGIRAAMAVSMWAAGQDLGAEPAAPLEARARAVERLDRALREFPGRSWGRDAALHVLEHTEILLDPGSSDASSAEGVDVEGARRRALHVLVVGDPRPEARADAWRLELAHRTAESDGGDGEMLGRATALLDGPWADRPASADRLEAWVRSRRVAQLGEDLAAAQRSGRDALAREAAGELAEAARAAIPVAQRVSPEAADALRADLAEALILAGSPEAAELYADLRARRVTLGRSEAEIALGHARALLAQGDDAGGFAVLREVTAAMPEPPAGADAGSATFWHAWTLTIETLAGRAAEVADEQPRRDAAAHLLRLHGLDPGLGGEPWASRLRAAGMGVGVRLGEAEEP